MMNYIWSSIMIFSILFSLISGNLPSLSDALMESSSSAVTFLISLAGIMAMWSGIMNIAEKTEFITYVSKIFLPFTKLLFPKEKNPETLSFIIMSFMSNIFGAGNSSTVFALKAMERLDIENNQSSVASNDMITFAVVNMAFAPILPVVTIKLRSDLGSVNPSSFLIPCLLTSAITVIVSILLCKALERKI